MHQLLICITFHVNYWLQSYFDQYIDIAHLILDHILILWLTLTYLNNDLKIWWCFSNIYISSYATFWLWHFTFSSISTYFGLFYLFVTHAKDRSRILKYSVIVGEITEPKCPHNNKQKFERFGWNESRPFPVQIHPRTIYFLVISVSRPEVAVLRNNLTLTALDPFPLYFS